MRGRIVRVCAAAWAASLVWGLAGCTVDDAPNDTPTSATTVATSAAEVPTITATGLSEPTPSSIPDTSDASAAAAEDEALRACVTLKDSGMEFEKLPLVIDDALDAAVGAASADPRWQPLADAVAQLKDGLETGGYGYGASVDAMLATNAEIQDDCDAVDVVIVAD